MIRGFEFRRRSVADWLEESAVIEPVDPFQRCVSEALKCSPWATVVNDFGLEEADDGFRQRVVVGIAHTSHRWLRTRLGQALGVPDRQILAAAIAVMHHTLDARARPNCLLQCIENQLGVHRARYAPSDDTT